MESINENSTRDLSMSFTDNKGLPVIPETVIYFVIDENTEQVMIPETTIVPEDTNEIINLPADVNIILDSNNDFETRILVVKWFYNNGQNEENDNYKFKIKNLIGVDKDEFS